LVLARRAGLFAGRGRPVHAIACGAAPAAAPA